MLLYKHTTRENPRAEASDSINNFDDEATRKIAGFVLFFLEIFTE